MTWSSKINQLLDKQWEIEKNIFAALHPAYDSQKSGGLVDKTNLKALYARYDVYCKAIGYSLGGLGKRYIIDQFNNITLTGITSADGTAACNKQQMSQQLYSGDKDSYYGCLDQLRAQLSLILKRDEKVNVNDEIDLITYTNKFDRFHIVGHTELSSLLNEYFQIPRDIFIALHASKKIHFEEFQVLKAEQSKNIYSIARYLHVRSKGYIFKQFHHMVSKSIPDCDEQRMSEYLFAGKQNSFDICSDRLTHKIALMLEDHGFLMQDSATEIDNSHTSDEL